MPDMTFDPMTLDHPLFEKQVEIEQEMRDAGIKRFRDNLSRAMEDGATSNTQVGQRLTVNSHAKMVEALEKFVKEAESGRAGRKHTALPYVKKLPMDVVANITIRVVLDTVFASNTLSSVAMHIAGDLMNEVNSKLFEENMPRAYEKFREKAKKETLDRRRWSHLLFPARLLGVVLEDWDSRDQLLVGTKLVEMFIEATGLVELRLFQAGKDNTIYRIEANEQTLAWIEEENNRIEGLSPVFMPTVIPPKPWTTPFDGGYYVLQNKGMTLVKASSMNYLRELAARDMPTVYEGINALQDTPWAVNKAILEVMCAMYEEGYDVAGVPHSDKIPLPNKPYWMPESGRMAREDMTEEQLEEFKAWKAEAHRVYETNAKNQSKRASFLRTISIAKRFIDFEAIYFPHQLDWRGRAYPVPLYLQPQGSDIQRGLLTFADALPISNQLDADWLAIHGAGCFGFDKVSLEERVQWVKEHQQSIVDSAMDPVSNTFWMDADKPWQFLAFCFDWYGFTTEGFGFMSSLPVQMDGTCNGLQNFSAMLLDEVGGAAVNLLPADTPQDIYQRVADIVKDMVARDMFADEPETRFIAAGWNGNVTRKVTKRPVMTLAYGAKRFGFVGQIEEDTLKAWRGEPDYPFMTTTEEGRQFDMGYRASMYMAGLIWEAVGRVVVAARNAMDWLQKAAQAVSKATVPTADGGTTAGMPIAWVTPSGLLVQQAYRIPNMKRIDTTFNSTRIRLHHADTKKIGKIDSRRQASGISPNWVHSLDASHLMATVRRASDEGIAHFSMIHDSYGTHAANASALAVFLREEFVRMYSEVDVLAVFKDDLEVQTGIKLPQLPPKGNLDLNEVLGSSFFFA